MEPTDERAHDLLRQGRIQVVTPLCGAPAHRNAIHDCAWALTEALRELGVDARVLDTAPIPPDAAPGAQAEALHALIARAGPEARQVGQVVLLHQPDAHFGLGAVFGQLARRLAEAPGERPRRLATYVHEFSELGARGGLAATLLAMALFLPLARLGAVAVTTEHERRALLEAALLGVRPARWAAPGVRDTEVVGIPSNIPLTEEARRLIAAREPGALRLALFGTFRINKGTDVRNEADYLGLPEVLDGIGRRVADGRLPRDTSLTVAGNVSDLSAIDALEIDHYGVLRDFVAAVLRVEPGEERALRAMRDCAAIEAFAAGRPSRYPFPIEIRLDRSDAEISRLLGRSHAGLFLSLRGASDRNGVLRAYALHELLVLGNVGAETREALGGALLVLYDDRERERVPPPERGPWIARAIEPALDALARAARAGRRAPSGARAVFAQLTADETARALLPFLARAFARRVTWRDRAVVRAQDAVLPPERVATDLRAMLAGRRDTGGVTSLLRRLERLPGAR